MKNIISLLLSGICLVSASNAMENSNKSQSSTESVSNKYNKRQITMI